MRPRTALLWAKQQAEGKQLICVTVIQSGSGYGVAKGKGVGKKNNFREGGVEGRREDKKKKAEKRLKFPTVLIKILLHAFLPRVPPDCP